MGLFDTISIKCPWCKNSHEEQVKTGDCGMNYYILHNAPAEVIAGVMGVNCCYACHKLFEVRYKVKPEYEVIKVDE